MRKSSYALAAALAVAVACSAPAAGAAPERGTVLAPADVSPAQCLAGGGILRVSADGRGGFVKTCQGGTHDGENLV
ncbi:hypothetical protein [Streptomyces sp. CRN 30]|uniref:hypothetical protein n=1 Tax=Streptomyces sp. CRN 30 TaxID=3075613 RepID=UPI002A7F0122|nr:hypothetical protein [Streptomyces sp. CRN 30]